MMNMSRGLEKASIVFKHAKIINVYSKEIEEKDIAVHKGIIIGIGKYNGIKEIDLKGSYVAPGFIDGHVHIESSMLTPSGFARVVVPKGTTTVIADPHEIANVSGINGIKFMLNDSKRLPLNVYMMVPSCVPATKEEHSGAVITVDDIKKLKKHPRVIGLGEVMDYPSVIDGNSEIFKKIDAMRDKNIDGHAPDIIGHDLNAYVLAGIETDHECTFKESMIERIRLGMYVHLREGSATRNTTNLLKGLKKEYLSRTLFCTDDKHTEDIHKEGHINYNVNLAIQSGMDPIDAISMATINAANCYHLKDVGGIAPGKFADFIVFSDLSNIQPHLVYKKGKLVAKNGKPLFENKQTISKEILHTVRFNEDQLSFNLPMKTEYAHVIGLVKQNIITDHLIEKIDTLNHQFIFNPHHDILKLAVIERHHNTNEMAVGLVKGFNIKDGAIAMTVAHDSHNLIIVGTSDENMRIAAKKIKDIQGGIVVVKDQKVDDYLQLEISGIMTAQHETEVEHKLSKMKKTIIDMGYPIDMGDPFIALAFLALPVIPKLKLTDRGLFDVDAYQIIPVEDFKKENL
ncbi:MAG: adenine deaminase [Bacillota bacterium]|nr:MAG: adenine deaminase [Bacillota bacterium]